MKAVIQRVLNASVTINHTETRSIGRGLMILLGVQDTDTIDTCKKLAEKCAALRIFDDADGNLNISAEENGYEAMVVSNFTLYGDTKKGRRPSFLAAAKPPLSVDCYESFIAHLKQTKLANVVSGEFGADMQIALVNDGPITIVIETDDWKK
ncbi:MAG: D-aminoacyl-tRNA deacylase [Ruthenibacterium sp.]